MSIFYVNVITRGATSITISFMSEKKTILSVTPSKCCCRTCLLHISIDTTVKWKQKIIFTYGLCETETHGISKNDENMTLFHNLKYIFSVELK